MGRHRTAQEKRELGQRAQELRTAGRSRRDIKAALGVGDDLLRELLAGTEVPPAVRRPRAKDEARAAAVSLRLAGATYDQIAAALGISKGTCSAWLRELPRPAVDAEHLRAVADVRWDRHRQARAERDEDLRSTAAGEVGPVDEETLLLLGAVAYWCEGAKHKPWRRGKFVFINSDPLLVRLMVLWLRLLDVPPERWVVRIQIHESGDLGVAEEHWRHVLGLPDLVFARASVKRHRPLTNRRNVSADYHGCVSIYVRRGAHLLAQVEGWVMGSLLAAGGTLPAEAMPCEQGCKTGGVEVVNRPRSAVG